MTTEWEIVSCSKCLGSGEDRTRPERMERSIERAREAFRVSVELWKMGYGTRWKRLKALLKAESVPPFPEWSEAHCRFEGWKYPPCAVCDGRGKLRAPLSRYRVIQECRGYFE